MKTLHSKNKNIFMNFFCPCPRFMEVDLALKWFCGCPDAKGSQGEGAGPPGLPSNQRANSPLRHPV